MTRITIPTLLVVALVTVTSAQADVLYVGISELDKVYTYDTTASSPTPTPTSYADTGLNGNRGLVLDPSGNLYVAVPGSILKFPPGGNGGTSFLDGNNFPGGLVRDTAGNLYVSDNVNGLIVKLTPTGVASTFASLGAQSFPSGLAIDSGGNIYVSSESNNTTVNNKIDKITPGGAVSVFASSGLNQPTGLAFDKAGNLYAANVGSSTIEKFTPSGVGSVFADATGGIRSPIGIVFDSTGNLFVANASNNSSGANSSTIDMITPAGVESVFASNLPGHPQYLAIQQLPQAVPEPSSLVLGCLGLVSLGLFNFARRRVGQNIRTSTTDF